MGERFSWQISRSSLFKLGADCGLVPDDFVVVTTICSREGVLVVGLDYSKAGERSLP